MPIVNEYFATLPELIELSANADNLEFSSSYIAVNPSLGGIEITGLSAPVSGAHAARVAMKNVSAFSVTLKANNTSSSAENRFKFPVDVSLSPGQYAIMIKLDEGYFVQSIITP